MEFFLKALVIPILTTVIMLLFVKYFPVQKAVNSQLLPFETLHKKYKRTHLISLLGFIIIIPVFSYLFYQILLIVSSLRFEGMIMDGFVILPDPLMWLVMAFFLAQVIALFSLFWLVKNLPTLKQAELIAYLSRLYRMDIMKVSNFVLRFVFIAIGIFYYLGINYYSHFGEEEIAISEFFDPRVKHYNYADINEIREVEKLIAPNGNTVNDLHFEIHFNDGYVWNSRMANSSEYERDSMIMEFVSKKTGTEIKEYEFSN